ncbi:MAG TPA: hypothetical protein VMF11_00270 [Candidatus Baltobacteraceae bacterium]|nr:hypothetical protein [Candidatus Baltobacteraceae bacterium]
MARILLQTTIPYAADDWHVGRFSLLRDELARAGHAVTARNREPDAGSDDPVLSTLARASFDQLWLMGVDTGDGLSDNDVAGIIAFRDAGGGVLTARDHADLGASIRKLGLLGVVNHFHNFNPEEEPARRAQDDQDDPDIPWPNYHSGSNGNYQRVELIEPVHEIFRSDRAPNGAIEFFPAHPHEGAVGAPASESRARVVARGRSTQSGRSFNIAVVIDGEPGRAVAESTFHHFCDLNWDVDRGCPSFVTDKPGDEMKRDPQRLETFKEYVRNIARWLTPAA